MGLHEKPVIVIGGGISGLCAAKLLVENNVDVIVLEAQNRVGGRTFTWRDPATYGWVDMGGSWVGPTQNHIMRLSRQLGLKTWVCYDDQDYMHYSKGRRCKHTTQWPGLFWSSPLAGFDLRHVAELMDRMCNEIPPDRPWAAPKAREWDQMTVQEFFKKTCWTKDAAEYLAANCTTSITSTPDQLSLLWYLWYIRSSNGMWRIWSGTNGAQERKFYGGSMTVSEKLHELLGDRVKLGQAVARIQQHDDGVSITTEEGVTYEGSYVVMTATMPMQLKLSYEPPLPPLRHQLLQRVSMGMCIKAQLWFKNGFWLDQGLNGFFTCADGEEIVGNTSVDIRDDCPYPAITAFVFSDKAAMAMEMDPEQRKEAILDSVCRVLQAPKGTKPVWYTEETFMGHPYIGGCYTATYPPGVMTTCGHVVRMPFKRMHFGGTETAAEWSGYMNGAVEGGERAAREILCEMGRIAPQDVYVKEPQNDVVPVRDFDKSFLERHPPSVGCLLSGLGLAASLAALGGIYLLKHAK